jgi:hypothetical protein
MLLLQQPFCCVWLHALSPHDVHCRPIDYPLSHMLVVVCSSLYFGWDYLVMMHWYSTYHYRYRCRYIQVVRDLQLLLFCDWLCVTIILSSCRLQQNHHWFEWVGVCLLLCHIPRLLHNICVSGLGTVFRQGHQSRVAPVIVSFKSFLYPMRYRRLSLACLLALCSTMYQTWSGFTVVSRPLWYH